MATATKQNAGARGAVTRVSSAVTTCVILTAKGFNSMTHEIMSTLDDVLLNPGGSIYFVGFPLS